MRKRMFYSLPVYLSSSPLLQNVLFIYVFDIKAASLVYILKVRISDWHCLDIIKKMPIKGFLMKAAFTTASFGTKPWSV